MTRSSSSGILVDVGETFARVRGYTEVNRIEVLHYLDLHSKDPVYRALSGIITDNLFPSGGTIVSLEAEEKKAQEQAEELKQKFDDSKAERDTMSRHPLSRTPDELKSARRSRKKNQAQDKKDKAEAMTPEDRALTRATKEKEEDLYPPEVNEAWARALPHLVKCFEAIGFGVAVSQATLVHFRTVRATLERSALAKETVGDPELLDALDFLQPLPETPDEDFTLHVLDPRTFRAFVRRDESYGGTSWLVMLPIVVDTQNTRRTPEEARLDLMSQTQVSDGNGKSVKWYVLDPLSVYVYSPAPENIPCQLSGSLRSYVSCLEPEREYEIANRHAMAQSNLVNASAPVPLMLKAGNMPKVDGSGESGNSHEDARENAPQATHNHANSHSGSVPAAGHIGTFHDPSVEREAAMRRAEAEAKAAHTERQVNQGLSHAYNFMANPLGAVMGAPVRRREWILPERYELGAVPVATPPTYYVEQFMKRWREAAVMFRIVVGVLRNYSVLDSASDTGSMGGASAGGKEDGLGGATSGTTSTAWRLFRGSMNAQANVLEAWSKGVLQSMTDKHAKAQIDSSVQAFVADRKGKFDRDHGGNEVQYSTYLMNLTGIDENTKQGMQETRRKQKESYLSESLKQGRESASKQHGKKRNDLVFKIPRVQTIELLVSFWEKRFINSAGLREELMRNLYLPEQFMELPEAMDQQRDIATAPDPEMAEEDGEEEEGGGAKKKQKKS
jgi:hypothetical protein